MGGPDQASKSQILSHFELALADLVATGRVTFLSQCRHLGEGRLESLLDSELTYQVEVRGKLVDATACETRVPSNSRPNFTVEKEVNFVPVNGQYQYQPPPSAPSLFSTGRPGHCARQLRSLHDSWRRQDWH